MTVFDKFSCSKFSLTTSETMGDCTCKHGIYELPHELLDDLRLLYF